MMSAAPEPLSWSERAAEGSPAVRRARARQEAHAQSIIDAGRRLVEGRGSFTTQELVKEAGVALQTFYRLFPSKDLLLLAVFESMIAEYCARMEEMVRSYADPTDRLRTIITSALQTAEGGEVARFVTAEHWRLTELFPDEMSRATQPFTDLVLRQVLEAAAESGAEPSRRERAAWFVTQLVLATFHHIAFSDRTGDREALGEQLLQFCRAGLGAETWVKE